MISWLETAPPVKLPKTSRLTGTLRFISRNQMATSKLLNKLEACLRRYPLFSFPLSSSLDIRDLEYDTASLSVRGYNAKMKASLFVGLCREGSALIYKFTGDAIANC